ncbi:MAG: hypothetical protein JRS35_16775 [Deltaproteobacteria bacterium]|nr:hypothetical protein [Deltaproteobacteria bacterium]
MGIIQVETSVTALAVAVLGAWEISPISPKTSFVPRVAIALMPPGPTFPRTMLTWPDSMK